MTYIVSRVELIALQGEIGLSLEKQAQRSALRAECGDRYAKLSEAQKLLADTLLTKPLIERALAIWTALETLRQHAAGDPTATRSQEEVRFDNLIYENGDISPGHALFMKSLNGDEDGDERIPRLTEDQRMIQNLRATITSLSSIVDQQRYDDPNVPIPDLIVQEGGAFLVELLKRREAIAAARATTIPTAGPQMLSVHTDPVVDWKELPMLDFSLLPSIFPYFRAFEHACDIAGCSPEQMLTHAKKFPQSSPGAANAGRARLRGDEDTYRTFRNRLINQLAHPHPELHLLMTMQKNRAKVNSTPAWRDLIRNSHTEMKMALEARNKDTPAAHAQLEYNLAVHAIDPYTPTRQITLLDKLNKAAVQQGILEYILGLLPDKFGNSNGLEGVNVSAASAYRPSVKQHSQFRPRGGNNNGRGGRTTAYRGRGIDRSLPNANMTPLRHIAKDAKKVDYEGRKCTACGIPRCPGRRACEAFGKECRKCGKKNHYSKFCRSTTILLGGQMNDNNNMKLDG